MTEKLEPYFLFQVLEDGEPLELTVAGKNFVFQFHGPSLGVTNNWLEGTSEDGVSWRFGPGHNSETVWRALRHAENNWNQQPFPVFKQRPPEEPTKVTVLEWKEPATRQEGARSGWHGAYWLSTADGFLGYPGPVSNHNRGLGADPDDRLKLTNDEYEVLRDTTKEQRVVRLATLRANTVTGEKQ